MTRAAVKMISETAHDLRSPLTAVCESIRLVRDGDLGSVNDTQHECLDSAMDQCGCMEQMVGEMVQLERLRTGTPRVRRQWTRVAEIRRLVDEALMPWAGPRKISVLWDGADDPGLTVFADPNMLRRLIVNLATNAIRASVEGGFVLTRIAKIRHGETVRWSIVDRGRGISEQEMRRVIEQQASYSGGEGLGLSISRQLASLQFSALKVRSRLGKGTEVSFETAASGPRSVASTWTRWRLAMASSVSKSRASSDAGPSTRNLDGDGMRQLRLDPPALAVSLSHEASQPKFASNVAVGVVSLGATVSRSAADEFDQLLQAQLKMFDLAYRVDARRWVWGLDADMTQVEERIEAITELASSKIPGLRINWSEPQLIEIDERRTAARLSDLMVRETLAASVSPGGFESDDVRPGTLPIAPSHIASSRLDAELARLAAGMKTQSQKLQDQAKSLRPVV